MSRNGKLVGVTKCLACNFCSVTTPSDGDLFPKELLKGCLNAVFKVSAGKRCEAELMVMLTYQEDMHVDLPGRHASYEIMYEGVCIEGVARSVTWQYTKQQPGQAFCPKTKLT